MKVLIIGYVWPEPESSAAGVRDAQLIRIFQDAQWNVTVSSPAKENEAYGRLLAQDIRAESIEANDPKFDSFITELQPDFVVFDRFIVEEQFGWRVREFSPRSIRIVDTQDLHLLRRARERALTKGVTLERIYRMDFDLVSEDALREMASIYRSDLTLILSDVELEMMKSKFQVPANLMTLSRFAYPPALEPTDKETRKNFVMIGNFRHGPNADGVKWLHKSIWPLIRKKLPEAEVHIYGAYPAKDIMALDDPKTGFRVLGHTPNATETIQKYRVNLAPLRYGAGIKGKVADGWRAGTPVVSTPIGSEGMQNPNQEYWGGLIAETPEKFAEEAIRLYSDSESWKRCQSIGYELLKSLFDYDTNASRLIRDLWVTRERIDEIRSNNLIGSMLWHHFHKSTVYFSKWIELKNSNRLLS